MESLCCQYQEPSNLKILSEGVEEPRMGQTPKGVGRSLLRDACELQAKERAQPRESDSYPQNRQSHPLSHLTNGKSKPREMNQLLNLAAHQW